MTIIEIKNALNKRPFRPFIIALDDQATVDVGDPNRVAISPDENSLIAYIEDGSYVVIDRQHVTRLAQR